jgi:hypothetical protein
MEQLRQKKKLKKRRKPQSGAFLSTVPKNKENAFILASLPTGGFFLLGPID